MPLLPSIAFRFLRSSRKEGFISVIAGFSFVGIALGVATLIVVMAVMNGFREELVGRILGINAHITLADPTNTLVDYEKLSAKIAALPGVVFAQPAVQGQVLATANGQHGGVVVKGMRTADFAARKLISGKMVAGKPEALDTEGNVIIGYRLAQQLNLLPGDSIRLMSPQVMNTVAGPMPRIKDYRVAGVFDVGMIEYDSGFVFMPMKDAQLYFKLDNRDAVTQIEVELADPQAVQSAKQAITQATGGRYLLYDWQQANAHFLTSLSVERNVMFLILSLIICIAAFNIIAGLVMMVTDKTREIAILRTMGASKGFVMGVFCLGGSAIGIIGTLLGLLLGVGFAENIEHIRRFIEKLTGTELFSAEVYFLTQLPAKLETPDVLKTVVMALSLSFLATLYPAWRAARIQPVEGLAHD